MANTVDVPGLTAEQVTFFHDNGFLVIPDFLSKDQVNSLLDTTNDLLENFDINTHPLTRFTTGDDPSSKSQHVGDEYFLTSNDKIRFFFEPGAFSPSDPSKLLQPKNRSVNKIGHSIHSLSKPFSDATHTGPVGARNAAIAKDLGFLDPRVLQSMVICKQPGIGSPVPSHKDSEFLYTDPPSAVGWWIALQDANAENGTLGFWKGSHKTGRIRKRFVRSKPGAEDGEGTEFVAWDGPDLPTAIDEESKGKEDYVPDASDYELVEIKTGSLVLIHGNVLHKSENNPSDKSRFAYAFHVIEGAEGWKYDERNWLQPPSGGFTRLFGNH
ncbi:phytanoyl-CoA dioxygenase [Trichophyton tonsurans CBS 112818]|uniref:Phytanoyl-CoA dioxygenase n=2 Tax=Trichophyton TaxID=5550 RepID=F2PL03_TRIEC|nr:phytanoyl-CoA dioxygenase [Trichophyton tonsurans CBS 112818]EGE02601.1 phytanoyl-CoA dioxygenase [Trichophyton equinum CBS 127.97]